MGQSALLPLNFEFPPLRRDSGVAGERAAMLMHYLGEPLAPLDVPKMCPMTRDHFRCLAVGKPLESPPDKLLCHQSAHRPMIGIHLIARQHAGDLFQAHGWNVAWQGKILQLIVFPVTQHDQSSKARPSPFFDYEVA